MRYKHKTYGITVRVDLGLILENWPYGWRLVYRYWGNPELFHV